MTQSHGNLKRIRHVAKIIGPSSAAARAIAEYDRRTAIGENVTIFEHRHSLIVGPTLPLAQDSVS